MSGFRGLRALWTVTATVLAVTSAVVLAACAAGPDNGGGQQRGDLAETVREFASGLHADARYRAPDTAERQTMTEGIQLLEHGDRDRAADTLRPLGFSVTVGTDPATGRKFGLAVNEPHSERGWGLYLVDLSKPIRVVLEVPHPNFDMHTEEIGLALFRAVPGAILAVSGTHRLVMGGAGDVAHRTDSMFHAVVTAFAEHGLPQVQLHGFDNMSLPNSDAVVSPGATDAARLVRAVASQLDSAGLRVCRAWQSDCGKLEGTINKQGEAAARLGAVFVHVELNGSVREDRGRWPTVVRALAAADLTG
ncbi:MAG: hypothetical protein JOZ47_02365 [Kutzneria sp.]|nr:hypothetical protein [Kutzneria sp.]